MVLVVSITSIFGPAVAMAMIIASALATASTSSNYHPVANFCVGYDKNPDCPGNYGFDSCYFDIDLGMGSDFIDLYHGNFGL